MAHPVVPHHRAARILHVPHPHVRATLLRLMRRYVAAAPLHPGRFKEDLVRAYSRALGLPPEPGALSEAERAQ